MKSTFFTDAPILIAVALSKAVPSRSPTAVEEDGLPYYVKPDSCEVCGEELAFWDDRTPMSDGDLLALCQKQVDDGCPNCGGVNAQLLMGCWD